MGVPGYGVALKTEICGRIAIADWADDCGRIAKTEICGRIAIYLDKDFPRGEFICPVEGAGCGSPRMLENGDCCFLGREVSTPQLCTCREDDVEIEKT